MKGRVIGKKSSITSSGNQELIKFIEAGDRAFQQAESLTDDDERAGQKAKFKEAIKKYTRALDIDYVPQVMLNQALCYINLGKNKQAIQCYDEYISHFTKHSPKSQELAYVYVYKGDASFEIEKYHLALRAYREAYALTPRDSVVLCKIGATYTVLEDYKKAFEYLAKSLQIDSRNLDTLHEMIKCCFHGFKDRALTAEYIEKVLKIDPTNKFALKMKRKNSQPVRSKRRIDEEDDESEMNDAKKVKVDVSPSQAKPVSDSPSSIECITSSSSSTLVYSQVMVSPPKKDATTLSTTFAPNLLPAQAAKRIALTRIESSTQLDEEEKDELSTEVNAYFAVMDMNGKNFLQVYDRSANTMLGLWGEETFYQLLRSKYKIELGRVIDRDYGFLATSGEKTVKVTFPNRNKFASYSNTFQPSANGSTGYDIKIEKVYTNKPSKKSYIEIKTTNGSNRESNVFSLSGPETEIMSQVERQPRIKNQAGNCSWKFIRFFSAGTNDVNYTKLKKVELVASSRKLKV